VLAAHSVCSLSPVLRGQRADRTVGFTRQAALQCAALVKTTHNNVINIEIEPR
jgi:hypothetical protein